MKITLTLDSGSINKVIDVGKILHFLIMIKIKEDLIHVKQSFPKMPFDEIVARADEIQKVFKECFMTFEEALQIAIRLKRTGLNLKDVKTR